MQEPQKMWVWSLDQEDSLEEEMATHSSILAWRIPWIEEPGGLQSRGLQGAKHDRATEHAREKASRYLLLSPLLVYSSLLKYVLWCWCQCWIMDPTLPESPEHFRAVCRPCDPLSLSPSGDLKLLILSSAFCPPCPALQLVTLLPPILQWSHVEYCAATL